MSERWTHEVERVKYSDLNSHITKTSTHHANLFIYYAESEKYSSSSDNTIVGLSGNIDFVTSSNLS